MVGAESLRHRRERSISYGKEDGFRCKGLMFRTASRVRRVYEIRKVAPTWIKATVLVAA